MMLPTIHRNGSHAATMLEDLMKTMSVLRAAIHHVQNIGPNGRDYYPQGPAAINIAMAEHESRLERLESVHKELETLAEHIAHHA